MLLNITRTVRQFRILPTALHTNQLYYNIYCVGLNTVFASVIPLLSLLYLNTRSLVMYIGLEYVVLVNMILTPKIVQFHCNNDRILLCFR